MTIEWNRRTVLLVAVVAVLLLAVGLVAATSMVTLSIHETDDDFESAEFSNMTIEGSGESAVVSGLPEQFGDTVSTGSSATGDRSVETGIVIKPNEQVNGFEIDERNDADTLYIVDNDNGDILKTADSDDSQMGGTTTVYYPFEVGEEYRIVFANDDESSYSRAVRDEETPVSTDSFDIVTGWEDGPETNVKSIEDISSIVGGDESWYQSTHDEPGLANGFVVVDAIADATATATWEENVSGTWTEVGSTTITSTGTHYVDLSSVDDNEVRLTLEAEASDDDWTFEVSSEGVEGERSEPEITAVEPEDGHELDVTVELVVDIQDDDFDEDWGDEVTVTFFGNDQEIHSEVVTEAGEVSYQWDDLEGGENEWYATAEDSYEFEDETETRTIVTPDELEIRDEVTHDLVDDTSTDVEVTFFAPDGTHVETRSTDDGVIDFTGLPVNTPFVISISAEDYHTRTTYIDDIMTQQTAYILHESDDSAFITFDLDDRTDSFPDDETRLVIERVVDDEYVAIAGDYFGASGEYSVDLHRGQRLRLSVANDDGQTRSLGDFTPEVDDIITLDIGAVDIGTPPDRGYAFTASSTTDEDDNPAIRVNYIDTDERTDQFRYRIVERGNESNVLQDWVTHVDVQDYSATVPISEEDEDTAWVVEYEITRDGDTIENWIPVGGVSPLPWPISSSWLQAFSLFAIVGTASMMGGSMSRTGAIFVVVMAFALTILGALDIPYMWLSAAGVVAVIFKFAEAGDGGPFP